jgi:SPP1 gp7 family putative phage head morphogenesis protein
MASRSLLSKYIERGLLLIRVANGLNRDAQRQLSTLRGRLSAQLSEPVPTGRLQRESLIQQLQMSVVSTYAAISQAHGAALGRVVGAEAAFAVRAAGYANAPSAAALSRAVASMLFVGAPAEAHWSRESQNIGFRVASAVRSSISTGATPQQLRQTVIGVGRQGLERGGVMQAARDGAEKIIDTGVHGAADSGRRAAWKANGIDAVRWFAILDPRVCINCGIRAGLLYTLDNKPIGHDVPMGQEPPFHYWCRCMLLPEKYPGGIDDATIEDDKFEKWLSTLSEERQDAILGKGRAALWRDDVITTMDLIDQNGLSLPLSALDP